MFDAIIKVAAANASKQYEVLENVSLNIANYNTTGYKAKRFEQFITTDETLGGTTRVDTSKGPLMMTKRELDVGVDGFGYMPITQPDGSIAYTRDGSFTLNSQGYIVTNFGDLVGEGIKVPIDYKKFQIKPDGNVLVQTSDGPEFKSLGKISLVHFAAPEKLKSLGYNKLIPTAESGPALPDGDSRLKQAFLERANYNVYGQVEQILRLNASMISNMRIIKFSDELYRQAVNLKQ